MLFKGDGLGDQLITACSKKELTATTEGTETRGPWLARLALATVACLYGSNYSVVKMLGSEMAPSMMMSLRFGLASLVLTPSLNGVSQPALLGGLEVGLYAALGYASQAFGLQTIAASQVALVSTLSVLVVPACEHFGGKGVGKMTMMAAALASTGAALLQLGGEEGSGVPVDLFTRVVILLQPIFFGLSTWRMETFSMRHPTETVGLTAAQVVVIGAASVAWAVAGGAIPPVPELVSVCSQPMVSAGLLWTGLVTTALVLYMETAALKTVPASEVAIIYTLEPLVGAALAVLTLGESFGPWTALGGAFVLTGCYLSSRQGSALEPEVVGGK
ncbi:unnamed protein product [Discosporangium mesarthrocarpum]